MDNEKNFLALGTVLIIKGTSQKVMIIQRAVTVQEKDGEKYFDYGAVMFPEGLIKADVIYFSEEDIFEVIDEGYSDENDKIFVKQLKEAVKLYENDQKLSKNEYSNSNENNFKKLEDIIKVSEESEDLFASIRDL